MSSYPSPIFTSTFPAVAPFSYSVNTTQCDMYAFYILSGAFADGIPSDVSFK